MKNKLLESHYKHMVKSLEEKLDMARLMIEHRDKLMDQQSKRINEILKENFELKQQLKAKEEMEDDGR